MFIRRYMLMVVTLLIALMACSPAVEQAGPVVGAQETAGNGQGERTANAQQAPGGRFANLDFSDVPRSAQLAFGIIQADGTDLQVSDAQAEEMLRLWQLLDGMVTDGAAADIEIEAVVAQIEGVLTADQINAVDTLELDGALIGELMRSTRGGQGGGQGGNFAGGQGGVPGQRGQGGGLPGQGRPGGNLDGQGGQQLGEGLAQDPSLLLETASRRAVIILLESKVVVE